MSCHWIFRIVLLCTILSLVEGSFFSVGGSRWQSRSSYELSMMGRKKPHFYKGDHRYTSPSIYTGVLRAENGDNSSDDENPSPPKTLQIGPFGSLEVLAITTGIFIVGLVYFLGDALFATPVGTAQVVFDADEVLKTDFVRIDTSVQF